MTQAKTSLENTVVKSSEVSTAENSPLNCSACPGGGGCCVQNAKALDEYINNGIPGEKRTVETYKQLLLDKSLYSIEAKIREQNLPASEVEKLKVEAERTASIAVDKAQSAMEAYNKNGWPPTDSFGNPINNNIVKLTNRFSKFASLIDKDESEIKKEDPSQAKENKEALSDKKEKYVSNSIVNNATFERKEASIEKKDIAKESFANGNDKAAVEQEKNTEVVSAKEQLLKADIAKISQIQDMKIAENKEFSAKVTLGELQTNKDTPIRSKIEAGTALDQKELFVPISSKGNLQADKDLTPQNKIEVVTTSAQINNKISQEPLPQSKVEISSVFTQKEQPTASLYKASAEPVATNKTASQPYAEKFNTPSSREERSSTQTFSFVPRDRSNQTEQKYETKGAQRLSRIINPSSETKVSPSIKERLANKIEKVFSAQQDKNVTSVQGAKDINSKQILQKIKDLISDNSLKADNSLKTNNYLKTKLARNIPTATQKDIKQKVGDAKLGTQIAEPLKASATQIQILRQINNLTKQLRDIIKMSDQKLIVKSIQNKTHTKQVTTEEIKVALKNISKILLTKETSPSEKATLLANLEKVEDKLLKVIKAKDLKIENKPGQTTSTEATELKQVIKHLDKIREMLLETNKSISTSPQAIRASIRLENVKESLSAPTLKEGTVLKPEQIKLRAVFSKQVEIITRAIQRVDTSTTVGMQISFELQMRMYRMIITGKKRKVLGKTESEELLRSLLDLGGVPFDMDEADFEQLLSATKKHLLSMKKQSQSGPQISEEKKVASTAEQSGGDMVDKGEDKDLKADQAGPSKHLDLVRMKEGEGSSSDDEDEKTIGY